MKTKVNKLEWEHLYRVKSDIGTYDFQDKIEAETRFRQLELVKCNPYIIKFW